MMRMKRKAVVAFVLCVVVPLVLSSWMIGGDAAPSPSSTQQHRPTPSAAMEAATPTSTNPTTTSTTPTTDDDNNDLRYFIMIDAGSTGSRLHVHRYSFHSDSRLPTVLPSVNKKIKPGLSSYAHDPERAIEAINDLIAYAQSEVPEDEWANTPVHLQATAGLRSVTQAQAEAILRVARAGLNASPFRFDDDWALVISGTQEGLYGWIATNYLLGAFRRDADDLHLEPHGVVEMGGSSMQITFSPHEVSSDDEKKLLRLSIGGRTYFLYTYSFLQYGLQAAEKLFQGRHVDAIEQDGNPCYPRGYRHSSTGNFDACFELMKAIVDKEKECLDVTCSFNGVYMPSFDDERFLAIENFFYTAKFFGTAADNLETEALVVGGGGGAGGVGGAGDSTDGEKGHAGTQGDVMIGNQLVKELKANGLKYCNLPWEEITKKYGKEDKAALAYYCFASAYEAAVLEHGFDFKSTSNLRPARQINSKAIDWELGSTIAQLMFQYRSHDIVMEGNDMEGNPVSAVSFRAEPGFFSGISAWLDGGASSGGSSSAGACRTGSCRLLLLLAVFGGSVGAWLLYRRYTRATSLLPNRGYSYAPVFSSFMQKV